MNRLQLCIVLLMANMPPADFCHGQSEGSESNEDIQVEVEVTARRWLEKAQETPLALTALTGAEAEERGLESLAELAAIIPNVSILDVASRGAITLTVRGISQVRSGEAPITVSLDGVNLMHYKQINQALFDVERIEVVKGPLGALYGRNAIGGAIAVHTKNSGPDHQLDFKAETGNANRKAVNLAVGGPLIAQKLSYRIAGSFLDRDGFHFNHIQNTDVDFLTNRGAYLKLRFTPTARTSLDLKVYDAVIEDGGPQWLSLPEDDMAGDTQTPFTANEAAGSKREMSDLSLKLVHHLGWADFTAVAAHSRLDEYLFADGDMTSQSISWVAQWEDIDAANAELRLVSNRPDRLRWAVGLYHENRNEDIDLAFELDLDGDAAFDTSIPIPSTQLENRANAQFVQLEYDVHKDLSLSAAARYDRDSRTQTVAGVRRDRDFDALQSRLGVSWSPSHYGLIYSSYAEGFRSGGFNPVGSDVFSQNYDKESTKTLELGWKDDWFERRFALETAVFHTQYDNQQYFLFDFQTLGQGIVNIDESTIRGLELSLHARVNESLNLQAAWGLADTRIDRFTGREETVGNRAPQTNQSTLNLAVDFRRQLSAGLSVMVLADYERLGKRFWNVDNLDFRKPVDLINLRAGFTLNGWRLTAFGRNLADKRFNAEFFDRETAGTTRDIRFPADPRSYGLEIAKKFDL